MAYLSEISLMQLKVLETKDNWAHFAIEPLFPGYGLTIGNALRRVLLSSIKGSAISSVRIDGISHEFSTIKGINEDVVELILKLKKVRFKNESEETHTISLDFKGEGVAKAGDFKCPTGLTVINKDMIIAHVNKGARLIMEATVECGRGYLPNEQRKDEKLPIGVIAVDSYFSPITKVNFNTENTRVGKMTNFDRLTLEIETDGSISPLEALETSSQILVDHFSVLISSSSKEEEIIDENLTTQMDSSDTQDTKRDSENPQKPVKAKTAQKTIKSDNQNTKSEKAAKNKK